MEVAHVPTKLRVKHVAQELRKCNAIPEWNQLIAHAGRGKGSQGVVSTPHPVWDPEGSMDRGHLAHFVQPMFSS